MKFSILFACLFSLLAAGNLSAQTPAAVEADLYKSFKKINNWVDYQVKQRDSGSADNAIKADDSLTKANDDFGKKLQRYTSSFPFTINQKFSSLIKERLDIVSSSDGLFRIYSWDTWTGGTMHVFENVLQYRSGGKVFSVLDTAKTDEDYIYNYDNLYTLKKNNKTYYLAIYLGVYSNKDAGRGIQIFTIENGKLKEAKLIRTKTGLHSKLQYDYDFFSVADIPYDKRPTITFDNATQTFRLPLIDGNQQVTKQFISYKFTGQYFERVKN